MMSTRNRECGEFFPLAGWGEAVEVDERNAVDHGMADLDDAAESRQSLLIDLLVGQKFRVASTAARQHAEGSCSIDWLNRLSRWIRPRLQF